MKCKNCKRKIPNKDWKTKNGCKWCDNEYYDKDKQTKELFKKIME